MSASPAPVIALTPPVEAGRRLNVTTVAMLVHNGVRRDTRVLKEARSLVAAGHRVEIHGISTQDAFEHDTLEDGQIGIFLSPRAGRGVMRMTGVVLALVALLAVLVLNRAGVLSTAVTGGLIALGLAACGLVYRFRKQVADLAAPVIERFFPDLPNGDEPLSRWGIEYMSVAIALWRSVTRRPAPDVIHLHDLMALILARALRKRFRVPVIWDAHEVYEDLADNDAGRAKRNAAIISTRQHDLDGFITINESIAAFYRAHYPGLPSGIIVMNATVPGPAPAYDGRLHEAAGLPPTQKIVLFQGGFGPHRGLPQLVAGAAGFGAEWTLVMMGWGALEGKLKRIAASGAARKPHPAVVFLPGVPLDELALWSAGATLGVIPYENTGLNHLYCTPNKLWEYAGAGVPVLCSELVEMSRLVTRHGFGFLLPALPEAKDIAGVVNNLDSTALAGARSACASFIAANNWSIWEQALLALYRDQLPISSTAN